MDQNLIFALAGVIIIGGLILVLISLTKKGKKHLDVEKYRVKYLSIEQQLKKDDQNSFHMTVLNVDKLLDQALREKGLRGNTMGERMKSASSIFSDNNGVWAAHKLRNKIAHEPDVHITYDTVRYALAHIKRALKDLGAI